MTSDRPFRRPIVAIVTASILVLALGLMYHALAARLVAPLSVVSLFGQLPMQIADWQGMDIPLDDMIVNRTATDVHISRRYFRPNSSESVSLYVGCGSNFKGVVAHRPDGCYPSHGWALEDLQSVELALSDGTSLPCRILQFSRGEVNRERVTVLHYFIAGGQRTDQVSLLQLRTRRLWAAISYVAQVQIVAIGDPLANEDPTTRLVRTFATDSAALIAQLFDALEKDRHSGETREQQEG